MPQLTIEQDSRQQQVEDRIADLGVMIALLEHDNLRVRQAIDRTGAGDLLAPVLDDQRKLLATIRRLQAELAEIWRMGQRMRWNGP